MPLHYEVLNSEFIDLTKVKGILKSKTKKEMSYEQKLAFDNAKEFAKLTDKKALDLIKELRGLEVNKLTDDLIMKIVDIMPSNIDELKLLLVPSKAAFKKEELDSLLNVVKKYA